MDAKEIIIEIANISNTFTNPNTNICTLKIFASSLFRILLPKKDTIDANIKHIIAKINASVKNILNTSLLPAPTARRIPISFLYAEIDDDMKFNNINAENTPTTILETIKICLRVSIVEIIPP